MSRESNPDVGDAVDSASAAPVPVGRAVESASAVPVASAAEPVVERAVELRSPAPAAPVARAVEFASAVPVAMEVELPSPPAAAVAVALAADPEPEPFACFFFSSAFFFFSFSAFSDAADDVEFPPDAAPEGFAWWCFFFSVAVDVPAGADADTEALALFALWSPALVFLLALLEVVFEDEELELARRLRSDMVEFTTVELGMAAPPVAGDRCGIPVEFVEFEPPPVMLDVELVVEFAQGCDEELEAVELPRMIAPEAPLMSGLAVTVLIVDPRR